MKLTSRWPIKFRLFDVQVDDRTLDIACPKMLCNCGDRFAEDCNMSE